MTKIQMTPNPNTTKNGRLYIALELSNTKWKIAFGNGIKIRLKTIAARSLDQFKFEVEKAKSRFGVAEQVD